MYLQLHRLRKLPRLRRRHRILDICNGVSLSDHILMDVAFSGPGFKQKSRLGPEYRIQAHADQLEGM